MTGWQRNLPAWCSLGLLAALVIAALAIVGWIKPYLSGPDLGVATVYRPKPIPVRVETVKWLERVERKTVTVPVEVIREVPPKTEEQLETKFGFGLSDLKSEGKDFVDVLAVPKAPHGGEMALTVNTTTGKVAGTFRPNPSPLIELGGMREVGFEYDPLNTMAGGYYRQDLVRIGPGIVNGKAFARLPVTPGSKADFGVTIGVAVRF